MIADIWKIMRALVTLADDLQKYHTEIKDIRRELRDLTIIVSKLAQEIQHSKERAESSHTHMLLELENRMLKFERRLPPAKDQEESK